MKIGGKSFGVFLLISVVSAAPVRAEYHGGGGSQGGGLTWGKALGLGVAGYAVGRAIRNHYERKEAEARYEQRLEDEAERNQYANQSSYDDDYGESSYSVPSPVERAPAQVKLRTDDANVAKVMTDLQRRSDVSYGKAVFDDYQKNNSVMCYALCGGYWDGSSYNAKSYDSRYYGQALKVSQVVAVGGDQASAFQNLKELCPAGNFSLISPTSYHSQKIYQEPLESATAGGVCFNNTKADVTCTSNCVASRKVTPEKTMTKTITSHGGDMAAAYLSLMYNPECTLKYNMAGGPFSAYLETKGNDFVTAQNSCTVGKAGHDQPAAAAPAVASNGLATPADGVTPAVADQAEVQCMDPLCGIFNRIAPSDKNCVQAVKKAGSSDVWFQFSDGKCPGGGQVVAPSRVKYELRGVVASDPVLEKALHSEEAQKRAKLSGFQGLLQALSQGGDSSPLIVGKIVMKDKFGNDVTVGTWNKASLGGQSQLTIAALCTEKPMMIPPGIGQVIDYGKVCKISGKDGKFTGIDLTGGLPTDETDAQLPQ